MDLAEWISQRHEGTEVEEESLGRIFLRGSVPP